ncbi:MAG: outer membrane protein assembly factor BamE [Azoarcus sp.]|nr:outer membrane protein assembly factor BamE [Azoarcus sp.]
MQLRNLTVTAIFSVFTLSACTLFAPYRIDIRQGNDVDDAMLAQVKPGMTREQVRFALGSPLVADAFHSDRWDYVYRFKAGNGNKIQQRAVSVFFVGDKLVRIEADIVLPENGEAPKPVTRMIEVPKEKS